MKYIKLFEDYKFNYNDIKELKDFCNENLAYLLDEGYKISIDKYEDEEEGEIIEFVFAKGYDENVNLILFNFDDIKDDFVPFLELLNDKYNLIEYTPGEIAYVKDDRDQGDYLNVEELYEKEGMEIATIDILIKSKK